MTPARWLLAALLLVTTVVAWLLASPQPDAPPAAAADSPPAQQAPEPARAVQASQAAHTTLAPLPAARPAPVIPPRTPIGAEGYGPHIERAQAGADAAAVWEAVQWLRLCASNEPRRNSYEQARDRGWVPEMAVQLMMEADAEARRCQTVTAQHRALLPELAARAMRAGVPEAASAYAGAMFASDLSPAQRQDVLEAMRRDARAGHAPSLLGAMMSHRDWGLSDLERAAYVVAYRELHGQQGQDDAQVNRLLREGLIPFNSPLSNEQWLSARLGAQQIIDRARAKP